jgi:hypothetical protein
MARGFESKNVESQQEERARVKEVGPELSAAEAARVARRRTLELTRARAHADLAVARSPAHRAMLEAAIKALDEQLQSI